MPGQTAKDRYRLVASALYFARCVVGRLGLEPRTNELKARCSTN